MTGTLAQVGFVPGDQMRASGLIDVKAVTAGGGSGTKGSWVELIASTTRDTYSVSIWNEATGVAATLTNCVVDIGVGAAASEVVLIPDVAIGFRRGNHGGVNFDSEIQIPAYIPAGSRVAARIAHHTANTSVNLAVDLYDSGPFGSRYPVGWIDVIGAVSAARGVDVTTGTSGSYGSVTSLGTLGHRYVAVYPCIQANETVLPSSHYRLRLHLDSSTDPVLDGLVFGSTTSEVIIYNQGLVVLPMPLPAGADLGVSISVAAASAEVIAMHVLGVRG